MQLYDNKCVCRTHNFYYLCSWINQVNIMTDSRICAKGQITDLSHGFRLPNGSPFSLYVRPISDSIPTDTMVPCKLICDKEVGNFPLHLGDWTPGKIVLLPPNAIDTEKFEIYWGASDNPY